MPSSAGMEPARLVFARLRKERNERLPRSGLSSPCRGTSGRDRAVTRCRWRRLHETPSDRHKDTLVVQLLILAIVLERLPDFLKHTPPPTSRLSPRRSIASPMATAVVGVVCVCCFHLFFNLQPSECVCDCVGKLAAYLCREIESQHSLDMFCYISFLYTLQRNQLIFHLSSYLSLF